MKRILLATSIDAYLHQGGGEQEIKDLHKALNKIGFLCDIYGTSSLDIDNYDVIIYFSLGNGINIFLDGVDTEDKTLILWPNLWFLGKPKIDYLHFLQSQVNRFDSIVIKTQSELEHLNSFFDLSNHNIIKISNFVDERLFDYRPSEIFKEVYNLDEFALWTGIIDPQKNQLEGVKLMKNAAFPIVFSGSVRDKSYFKKCVNEANGSDNIIFLPPMHYMSELHLSALSSCSMYLEAPLDHPGKSSIEAAFLNDNIILTDCEWTREIFTSDVLFIDPVNMSFPSLPINNNTSKRVLSCASERYMPVFALSNLTDFLKIN